MKSKTTEVDPMKTEWSQLQTFFVAHPVFEKVTAEIEFVMKLHGTSDEPPCMQICGTSGIGKSTVRKKLKAKYKVERNARRITLVSGTEAIADYVPMVAIQMPTKPKVISVGKALLRVLGDPQWYKGTAEEIEYRLHLYVLACGTKAILLDDTQRLLDRNGVLTAQEVVDFFKTLYDQTGVIIILLGLPRMKYLVEEDTQFERLWDNIIEMNPYDWGQDDADDDGAEPESRLQFLGVLVAFVAECPVPFSDEVDVTNRDIAKRFYYSSRGVTGRLKKFLAMVMRLVMQSRKNCIDFEVLREAFDLAFRKDKAREKLINPWGSEWKGQLPPPLQEDGLSASRIRAMRRGRKVERNRAVVAGLAKAR
jgi:archaellum biogenesis ATPase FlaH